MARVLLLALRFWPATGGVEARLWEVARRLAKQHDITVLTSDLERERPFARFAAGQVPAETGGLRIVRLPAVQRAPVEGYGVHLRGLRSALRQHLEEADLLDVHPYGAAHTDTAVPLARRAGVPVALTAHFHPADTAGHPWLRGLYDALRGGPTLRRADKVVAVTAREAEALRRAFRVAKERLTVIPNGLDTEHYRDLGGKREEGLLLCVGRLAPVKGFGLALDALSRLRREGREVRLVLAGEDWGEGAALRAQAAALGLSDRVTFLGLVDPVQLRDLYNRAQVLVVPSLYEAFGITALEAVACGCPVVASDVGGLPDAMGGGGVAVPRDAGAFAGALGRLLDQPQRLAALRREGRAHAERHDWSRVAAQVDALWRGLVP